MITEPNGVNFVVQPEISCYKWEDDYRDSPVSFDSLIKSISKGEEHFPNESVIMLHYCDLEEFFINSENSIIESSCCDTQLQSDDPDLASDRSLNVCDLEWLSVDGDGLLQVDLAKIDLSELSFCDFISLYKHTRKTREKNNENNKEDKEQEVETLSFDDLENFLTWNLSDISYEYLKNLI